MAAKATAKATPKGSLPSVSKPAPKGPKPGAASFTAPTPPGPATPPTTAARALPKMPTQAAAKPAVPPPSPTPIRAVEHLAAAELSPSEAPPDCLPISFDDEASCVVIGESEYYYPSREVVATVGQLCSFLELQADFAGKVVQPLSSRARKIGSREAKSSTVSFVRLEDAAGERLRAASLHVATSTPPSPNPPAATALPSAATPMSSVERAKLAAVERFRAEQKLKEVAAAEENSRITAQQAKAKVSNKELLADLDEDDEDEKELNYGKFGKTVAPPGRRLPTTRYRKHLDDLKKRSKRMEYRQKFFVMEKEKKQEELQKRLDEIDEENLRAERERRKKQEEEYDNLYGAELERKKKLQGSVSSILSEFDAPDTEGGGSSEPLDPDAALFALTPGFSQRQEENEFAIKPGSFGASEPGSASQGRSKQRLTLMLKDMLNNNDEPTSADAIVDFSALARAPKKAADAVDAKERKLEELRQKKEELRRREEELNAQLAKRPASATPGDLMTQGQAEDEPGFKTIMVQGRPRRVPVSASSASLVGASAAAPVGSGRRVKP